VSWAFASSFITIPLSFILRIFLARWLGPSDLGLYQMVITIYSITMMAAAFGIPTAIIKFSAEYRDDRNQLNQFMTTGVLLSILLGVVAGIVVYILSSTLSTIFNMPELSSLLKLLALIFPFTCIFQTSIALVNGLRWMRRYAFLIFLQSITMITFTTAFVAMGFALKGAVSGLVISMAFTSIVSLAASLRFYHVDFTFLREKALILLGYGRYLFGSDAMNIIAANSDILLIGFFLNRSAVGFYSIAISISMILAFIPTAIQKITYPAASEFSGKDEVHQLTIMLDKSMKYTALVLVPMGLFIVFYTEEIIGFLFGESYLASSLPLIIMIAGRVIRGSISGSIGSIFTSIGRPEASFFLDAFSAISGILLMVLLIPSLGINGAALSNMTAMILGTVIFIVLISHLVLFRIDMKWYLGLSVLALLCTTIFFLLNMLTLKYFTGPLIICVFFLVAWRYFLTRNDIIFFTSYLLTVKERFTRKKT